MTRWSFTSESVTEGHPDKVCDQISDSVLDEILRSDPNGRVACEALVNTNLAVVAGEITTTAEIDLEQVVRQTIQDIGYTSDEIGMDGSSCRVVVSIDPQSPDVAVGLFETTYEERFGLAEDDIDTQGAGDQGMMFGYACDETEDLMPLPIWWAHRLAQRLAEVRKSGVLPYLRPDGKTQATFEYEDGVPVALDTVLISAQHDEGIDVVDDLMPDLVEHVIRPVVPEQFADDDYRVIVNPTGVFVRGGPHADCGLTGRKTVIDTYGGAARHGGGAFSGKDPTKTDRCGAYAARWIAKNIVASGAARRCEIQVAYGIGVARPLSLFVDTFGTETVDRERIAALVSDIDFRPAAIIRDLDLARPIYRDTATYGHFGRSDKGFPWEQTNLAEQLASELGLAMVPS